MNLSPEKVKSLARTVGFDLCGIAAAEVIPEANRRYHEWLEKGHHADMDWMAKYADRRADASKLAEGIKSVIVLGLNYYQPNSDGPPPPDHGRVSRYARGRDYHKVVKRMCEELIARIEGEIDRVVIRQERPLFKHWVDYGPMLERPYAVKAGLGYIGKNSMLINQEYGSWLFLAEIVTSLDLEPAQSWPGEHGCCGTCRRCIDACPTGAITEDKTIDSRRCLSYLTIEHREEIPREFAAAITDQAFGCDICQQVCPHNAKRQRSARHHDLQPAAGVGEFLDCRQVLQMESEEQFLDLTAGTPLTRAKLEGLKRNSRVVLSNQIRDDD